MSSRTQEQLDQVVAEIAVADSRGLAVVADAADEDDARSPVRAAMAEYGRVDVLVNNVGGSAGGNHDPFSGDTEAFMGTLRLNLVSAFWTSQEALPPMREQSYGRIINIGSGASKRAAASVAYTAAKHGLVGLTKQMAMSAAPYGITVNCLCPGWTNTSLVDFERLATAKGISAAQGSGRRPCRQRPATSAGARGAGPDGGSVGLGGRWRHHRTSDQRGWGLSPLNNGHNYALGLGVSTTSTFEDLR